MSPGRRMIQLWQMSRPKNILRLWLWLAPPLHQKQPLAIASKNGNLRDPVNENSKENLLLARESSDGRRTSTRRRSSLKEVPKGFLAVYVGSELRRFVIPASYLSMPDFMVLMERAAEEFGFEQEGGLRFPCEVEDFEEILVRCLAMHQMMKSKSKKKKNQ
ncbi:hypothetical protein L1049_003666 [Liquidambar formosana]|uniref:Small auxin up regulated protein n=1 Tax=Liquidambar formosana TaxID=63359 RepID=A0AAP0WVB3_LIQFO